MKNLPSDQATAREVPANILKNSEILFFELTNCINKAIRNNNFPNSLKRSDTTPVYKKINRSGKASYRPVSVLPLLSKVFENIIYNQLDKYMENFPSELLCGFRKAHSMQNAFFRLLQK